MPHPSPTKSPANSLVPWAHRCATGARLSLFMLVFTGLSLSACTDPVDGAQPELPTRPDTSDATVGDAVEVETTPVDVFAVASLFPGTGPTSGFTQVEIYGQGLKDVVSVRFGQSGALEALAVSDTLVVALTPPRPRGLVDVIVTRKDGTTAELKAAFRFESDIQITEVTPANGHVLGGDPVTVRGLGFTSDTTLVIGGRQALAVELVDDTTLVAITPQADTAGRVDVHVAGSEGTGTLNNAFEYFVAPDIEGVLPAAGPMDQASTVDIVGAGFTTPMAVTVDGRPATEVTVTNSGLLSATFPPSDQAGAVDVVISTPFGTTVAGGGFTYMAEDQADTLGLFAVHPTSGPTYGGTHVTLTATAVTQAVGTTVRFGGSVATIMRVDPENFSIQVATPAVQEAGAVDVTVTVAGETVTLPGAFAFVDAPSVHEVFPNHGPLEGETPVTITGTGFATGAAVRIGALPAASVKVVDETTITAVTAPGSPGSANVTVLQNGVTETLFGGFVYKGALDVFVVSPSMGSQAGGTLVEVLGDGFTDTTKVFFGGIQGEAVETVSSTRLWVRTPPGELGGVDVEVRNGSTAALQPKGFTYFDPSSTPGTWGPKVNRNLNVTVVGLWTREPIPNAAVILGDNSDTPYQGYTDERGQITFSGQDLAGPQSVTSTAADYATAQILSFDSENVSLGLDPKLTCSQVEDLVPCDQPPGEQAAVDGEVKAPFKGTFNPVGSCDDESAIAAGTLCLNCTEDADCGTGEVCTELQDQGPVCTAPCTADSECPNGFACLPISPSFTFQCVPSAGELRTYCDITESSFYGQPQSPAWPGTLVDADGKFDMPSRLGDFAVFCWSGLYKDGVFTPQKLGVLRNQGAYENGTVVATTIDMNHPIDTPIEIVLDRPDIGPPPPLGEEGVVVRVALDLGSDGILEFPTLRAAGRDRLEAIVPQQLSGTLAGAKWIVEATVANSFLPNSSSTTREQGVTAIASDRAFKLNSGVWGPVIGSKSSIYGISSANDAVFGVGSGGQILRSFANEYWALMQSGTKRDLLSVSAASDGTAVAGGADGTILHFDGITWSPRDSGTTEAVRGVYARSSTDAFAVAGTTVLRLEAGAWTPMFEAAEPLADVTGDADGGLWVVGDTGFVARYSEDAWSVVTTPGDDALRSVLSTTSGDIYVFGAGGTVWQFFDGTFAATPGLGEGDGTLRVSAGLNAAWESSTGDLWFVGDRGTILRRSPQGEWFDDSPKHRSNFLAVGGVGDGAWAMGSQEFVMGPMIAVPEDIRPVSGGSIGGPWNSMTWEARDEVAPHFNVTTLGGVIGPCMACGMTFVLPFDEWHSVSRGTDNRTLFAGLTPLSGKPYLESGIKPVAITRVYMDDEKFDFDEASGQEFRSGGLWRSWAVTEHQISP